MNSKRLRRWVVIGAVALGIVLPALAGVFATKAFAADQATQPAAAATAPAAEQMGATANVPLSGKAIAFGLAILSGAIGAGYAVAKVGAAAVGAVTERPEMMGRALVFVALAEGIAVWGMLGAILLVVLLK